MKSLSAGSSPLVIRPAVSSASFWSLTKSCIEVQLLVRREKGDNESSQLCGAPLLMVQASELWLLSVPEKITSLSIELGTFFWEGSSWRRVRTMELKAKLKSTNRILTYAQVKSKFSRMKCRAMFTAAFWLCKQIVVNLEQSESTD